jgi:IPT/TIG domain-containing protein
MRRKRGNDVCALLLGMILSINLLATPTQTAPRAAVLPHLDSLSPTMGPIGTQVTAHGTGFTAEDNLVLFDGFGAIPHVASNDGTTISFTVPEYLDPYCRFIDPPCGHPSVHVERKRYQITVQNTQGITGTLSFTVTGALYMPLVISARLPGSPTSIAGD